LRKLTSIQLLAIPGLTKNGRNARNNKTGRLMTLGFGSITKNSWQGCAVGEMRILINITKGKQSGEMNILGGSRKSGVNGGLLILIK
jgi:hypothetical protein